jgi:uncharacterized C2H2 Zn-finger protein
MSACGFCHGKPVHNAGAWTSLEAEKFLPCPRCGELNLPELDNNDHVDLGAVWARLDDVRELGALAVSATFLTTHGLVSIASGPDGRAMAVNGAPIPLEDS